jgi:hypothetical protein
MIPKLTDKVGAEVEKEISMKKEKVDQKKKPITKPEIINKSINLDEIVHQVALDTKVTLMSS